MSERPSSCGYSWTYSVKERTTEPHLCWLGLSLHRASGWVSKSGEKNQENESGRLTATCAKQTPGSLFRNYQEFQDSDSKALKQERGSWSTQWCVIVTCPWMKAALIMEQIQGDSVMGKQLLFPGKGRDWKPQERWKGAIQEEKAEEFSETHLKVTGLVNKPTNSCYHKPVVRTYCKTQGALPRALWWLKGREIKKIGEIYIHLADSLCCMVG